jgi:hypothetical protein
MEGVFLRLFAELTGFHALIIGGLGGSKCLIKLNSN